MKVSRKEYVVASIVTVFTGGSAFADLNSISVDAIDSGMGIGTTYRVYADVDAGDQVNAVYGEAGAALHIESSTSFYQNAFGSQTPPSAALIAVFPSLAFDSFVSIGRLTDTDDGMLEIGIDWDAFEGSGGAIDTDNGSWFATPDNAQVYEVDGRVLIGQFTTDGDVSSIVNIQGKDDALNNWNAIGVEFASGVIPAPGAIALLGMAGLVLPRRRRR